MGSVGISLERIERESARGLTASGQKQAAGQPEEQIHDATTHAACFLDAVNLTGLQGSCAYGVDGPRGCTGIDSTPLAIHRTRAAQLERIKQRFEVLRHCGIRVGS